MEMADDNICQVQSDATAQDAAGPESSKPATTPQIEHSMKDLTIGAQEPSDSSPTHQSGTVHDDPPAPSHTAPPPPPAPPPSNGVDTHINAHTREPPPPPPAHLSSAQLPVLDPETTPPPHSNGSVHNNALHILQASLQRPNNPSQPPDPPKQPNGIHHTAASTPCPSHAHYPPVDMPHHPQNAVDHRKVYNSANHMNMGPGHAMPNGGANNMHAFQLTPGLPMGVMPEQRPKMTPAEYLQQHDQQFAHMQHHHMHQHQHQHQQRQNQHRSQPKVPKVKAPKHKRGQQTAHNHQAKPPSGKSSKYTCNGDLHEQHAQFMKQREAEDAAKRKTQPPVSDKVQPMSIVATLAAARAAQNQNQNVEPAPAPAPPPEGVAAPPAAPTNRPQVEPPHRLDGPPDLTGPPVKVQSPNSSAQQQQRQQQQVNRNKLNLSQQDWRFENGGGRGCPAPRGGSSGPPRPAASHDRLKGPYMQNNGMHDPKLPGPPVQRSHPSQVVQNHEGMRFMGGVAGMRGGVPPQYPQQHMTRPHWHPTPPPPPLSRTDLQHSHDEQHMHPAMASHKGIVQTPVAIDAGTNAQQPQQHPSFPPHHAHDMANPAPNNSQLQGPNEGEQSGPPHTARMPGTRALPVMDPLPPHAGPHAAIVPGPCYMPHPMQQQQQHFGQMSAPGSGMMTGEGLPANVPASTREAWHPEAVGPMDPHSSNHLESVPTHTNSRRPSSSSSSLGMPNSSVPGVHQPGDPSHLTPKFNPNHHQQQQQQLHAEAQAYGHTMMHPVQSAQMMQTGWHPGANADPRNHMFNPSIMQALNASGQMGVPTQHHPLAEQRVQLRQVAPHMVAVHAQPGAALYPHNTHMQVHGGALPAQPTNQPLHPLNHNSGFVPGGEQARTQWVSPRSAYDAAYVRTGDSSGENNVVGGYHMPPTQGQGQGGPHFVGPGM